MSNLGCHMSHLSSKQLAELARITTRQAQRILERGTPNLGATRTPGGHWIIPDSTEVRRWARKHQRWKRGGVAQEHDFINSQILGIHMFSIPNDTRQGQWADIHRDLLWSRAKTKKPAAKWLKLSRTFASDRWGVDYVAETEVQLELGLGLLDLTKPDPVHKALPLNPKDKTTGIMTIEGLSQKFIIWHRKMRDEMPRWNKWKIKRAIELVEPMARLHAELLARLKSS